MAKVKFYPNPYGAKVEIIYLDAERRQGLLNLMEKTGTPVRQHIVHAIDQYLQAAATQEVSHG